MCWNRSLVLDRQSLAGRSARWLVLGAVMFPLWGTVHAQAVRPGLWEFDGRQTRLQQGQQSLDMQKIQQQVEVQMRGMSAESRRMLEENLRGAGVVTAKGRSLRVCVPPEQANLARLAERNQQEGCSLSLNERGADFVRGQLRCTEPQAQGSFLSTLITPERINNRAEIKTAQGQLVVHSSAQWLSPDCQDAPALGTQSLQSRSLFGDSATGKPPAAPAPGTANAGTGATKTR